MDNPEAKADSNYIATIKKSKAYYAVLRRIPELGDNDAAIISERIAYDEQVENILDEDSRAWLHLARAAMRMAGGQR